MFTALPFSAHPPCQHRRIGSVAAAMPVGLLALVAAAALATAGTAHAGRSCEARPPTAQTIERGMELARRTADALALAAPLDTWSDGSSSSANPSSMAVSPPIHVSESMSFAMAFASLPVRAA